MRGVEHDPGACGLGSPAHRLDVVGKEDEACPDHDHPGPNFPGPLGERLEVDRDGFRVQRDVVHLEPVEPRRPLDVVGGVAGGRLGDRHDRISGKGHRHEGIKVRHRSAEDPELHIRRAEEASGQFCGDDLNEVGVGQAGFVLVPRVA